MIGQVVSHYRIVGRLGEGGMGEVYVAEDTNLGRRVAIKFPLVSTPERDYRARFLREARAISELSNPHIATLYDYGESADGRPFLVMELIKGETLGEVALKGTLTLPRALEIIEAVAAALAEAHSRGIVHRDIKPSNIMIDDRGQIKVLDFGLAKQLNEESIHVSEPEAQTLLNLRTRSGAVLGTPAYLSPEQAMGGTIDARSDLFALGGVLYECVTGKPAFPGSSFIEIAANVIHIEPEPPSRLSPGIPPELDSIVLKALAKEPDKRYQSSDALIADLHSLQDRLKDNSNHTLIKPRLTGFETRRSTLTNVSQILSRPRVPVWYILLGLIVVAGLAAVGWRLWRPPLHIAPAEAQNWYNIGSNALRDGSYYQASQALERAIAIDDRYVLAHARLAEAFVELDAVDKAKDELLRVTALADRSRLPQVDGLYVDGISAVVRHDFAAAINSYAALSKLATDADKPNVLVDLGRVYEKNEEPKKAIESYADAANRNPQYATAFLRLGILYGRQHDLANALASFDKADGIFQAMGNLEGRTEVAYQRGALFNQLERLAEAKTQLEQAITLAAASNNVSQKIKALLQLSLLSVDAAETERAASYAREAVDLAQKNGLQNLSAQGLIELGYGFLVRGDYSQAENYFLQALETAERAKARSNEARARSAMASLRQQQHKPDEVVTYIEPALAFYQQGGYRASTSQCLALLARANLQKGDYAAAQKAQEQLLALAREANDQSMLALALSERASSLSREEKFNESLDYYTQAYQIYVSQGIQRTVGYNLASRAYILGYLGRFNEAQSLLGQAGAIAEKPGSEIKRLSAEVKLLAAQIALAQGTFANAKSNVEQGLAIAGTQYPDTTMTGKSLLGLVHAYSGAAAVGKLESAEAFDLAKQLNDPWESAKAQLALAETLLIAGDYQGAFNNAGQAQEVFNRLGQQASEWRALALAGLARAKLGDKVEAREYASRANDSLSKLEQRWGKENLNGFLARADVQRLQNQLKQLNS